jgi:hypothetical protein
MQLRIVQDIYRILEFHGTPARILEFHGTPSSKAKSRVSSTDSRDEHYRGDKCGKIANKENALPPQPALARGKRPSDAYDKTAVGESVYSEALESRIVQCLMDPSFPSFVAKVSVALEGIKRRSAALSAPVDRPS